MICNGTVKKYCSEDLNLIENYKQAINDKEKTWDCHHRLETDLKLSVKELIARNMYYNRPACELIFLPQHEHLSMHSTGRTFSEEAIKKLKEINTGRKMSDETKKKMSDAKKGKKQSIEQINKRAEGLKKYYETHDGYYKNKKLAEETKKKMSDAHKGKRPANLDALLENQKLNGSPTKGKHRVYDENGKYHYE